MEASWSGTASTTEPPASEVTTPAASAASSALMFSLRPQQILAKAGLVQLRVPKKAMRTRARVREERGTTRWLAAVLVWRDW